MLTLMVKRGRVNVVHQLRVQRLIGNPDQPWTLERFQQFIQSIGAHQCDGVYVDWWNWVYQLQDNS